MRSILVILLGVFAIFSSYAQNASNSYEYKTFKKGDNSLNYRILYPNNFDENNSYPLIVFLHGMGERGTDNNSQLVHGSKLFQDSIAKYPAIVIFPQCPPTDYWANLYRPDKGGANRRFEFHVDEGPNPSLDAVISLIESMLSESYVNSKKLYVGGLSMGGMGAWELLWRIPDKIAAAFPICGGGPPKKAKYMTPPVWAFHGAKDDVVHPRMTISMVRAMQQNGQIAKISLYPEANHNSWDSAFAEPKLLSWLFSKSLK